jgi:Leucine-rich repeat (LRR) protein
MEKDKQDDSSTPNSMEQTAEDVASTDQASMAQTLEGSEVNSTPSLGIPSPQLIIEEQHQDRTRTLPNPPIATSSIFSVQRGLKRTAEEQAAKNAARVADEADEKMVPVTHSTQEQRSGAFPVAQPLPGKGLHRTPEEREAKMQALLGGNRATARNLPLGSAPNKHGLHRTPEELQAKLNAIRGKHSATSQEAATSTVAQSLPHKGLHRTPEERAAKMQALLGGTRPAHRYISSYNGTQTNTDRAQDPPDWINEAGISDEDQSQESSSIVADLNQDNSSNDGWLDPQAELPTVGQLVDSEENPTPGTTLSPPSQTPRTTRMPTGVMDTALTTTGNNDGLVEARAVMGESTMDMNLQTAQQVDSRVLANALELTTRREQQEKECRRWGYGIITVSLVVIGLSLGVGLGTRKPGIIATVPTVSPSTSPSCVPSSAPTGHLDLLYDDLPDYTQESLQNASTAQWKAWDWLSNHQNITRLPEWRKKQLFALATFFYSFEGENWNPLIGERWMEDTVDECLWFSTQHGFFDEGGSFELSTTGDGLSDYSCNSLGEFAWLDLQNLQLSGFAPYIPPEISLLSSLNRISLLFNDLEEPLNNMLPAELFAMTNITFLEFGKNYLTGLLPSELGRMTNLEFLNLFSNFFSGSLFSELGEMTSLVELRLYNTSLTGLLPSELGRMTNLTSLSLGSNSFSGSLFSELGEMTSLVELHLFYNSLTGLLPSELGRMTNLTSLNLLSNSFSGSLFSELGEMTSLVQLGLYYKSLTGVLPSELGRMTNLTSLYLDSNFFSGSLCSELGDMTSLVELHLENNSLTGLLPSELGRMTDLEFLYLDSNSFSGSLFSELGGMTSLVQIALSGNSFSGPIPSELGVLTLLQWLHLSNLTMVNGSIPSELGLLTSLRYLNLIGSNGLSGTIPSEFCNLQNSSCTFRDYFYDLYNCTLDFDCSDILCGCDCPCLNGTAATFDTNKTDALGLTLMGNASL